ncbi:MAG: arsenate reductase ArsC [archaeon]|nr:arsenate reductase ArsC [archaeon]
MAVSNKQKFILFVCIENAGRSQMADAFAAREGLTSMSAGTNPGPNIYPTVIGAMREKGLDISKNKPKLLTPEMIDRAQLVVTMGCAVEQLCPRPMLAQLQKKLVDWEIEDPKGKSISDVRKIRDAIENKVKQLAMA